MRYEELVEAAWPVVGQETGLAAAAAMLGAAHCGGLIVTDGGGGAGRDSDRPGNQRRHRHRGRTDRPGGRSYLHRLYDGRGPRHGGSGGRG